MYAWQNRTVIDAHDKLLIHFQILVHLEPKKEKEKKDCVEICKLSRKDKSIATFVQWSDETWQLALHPS